LTKIVLAPQQVEALAAVDEWLLGPDQTFYLAGYAGTGKTTIAKQLPADFYMAYTGKAAHVLQEKGCPATTIHKRIYIPQNKSSHRLALLEEKLQKLLNDGPPDPEMEGKLNKAIFEEKSDLKRPAFLLDEFSVIDDARLVVIDECSMVGERMGADLESFGCKILVLGDPFQLPPVKSGGYFTEREPNFLLTDIHRQAEGDPILGLATHIRTKGRIDPNHECVDYDPISPEEALEYDQIICGRNKTRHKINRRIRLRS
jgi:exodeoxyribonuclease-5